MQVLQKELPFLGPLLSNHSQADEPNLSPVGSQMPESSTHQIPDSQPPEAASVSQTHSQDTEYCIHTLATQLSEIFTKDYAASVPRPHSQVDQFYTSSLAVQKFTLKRLRNLENHYVASVPGPLSQTDRSDISSPAVQESQSAEDCSPASPSAQEKQSFVKEELASLTPVPSIGEHHEYSRSNYFSETESSNHPPNEKGNLKIFKHTEAYMPKAVQYVINLYNTAALEDPKKQNAAVHDPLHPSLLTSVVVKLELGNTARVRELPTEEGHTHDFNVYVRGPACCAIEHFVSSVVFRLPLSYPRPIVRARMEPPYEINVTGCAGFTVDIYIFFRTKEKPNKIALSYDINLKSGDEVSEVSRRKLIFQNPGSEFRKKLLLGGGVPCWSVCSRYDSPCEASSSTFIPNELATSPVQSQESNSVTADANQSTVEGGELYDGLLTIVYDNQQNESFLSPTVKSPCDSDLIKGQPDSGHNKDMVYFYHKVLKMPSSNGSQREMPSSNGSQQEIL